MTIITDQQYKDAADVLAQKLPAGLKRECDLILGKSPSARERWSLYQTTLTMWESHTTDNQEDQYE